MMKFRLMTQDDLGKLLESEHHAFPTVDDNPTGNSDEKLQTYKKWISKFNLSLVLEDERGDMKGLLSVVPVNLKGWKFIFNKKDSDLNEYQLVDDLLFDPEKDSKLGLHVYMIEKFDKSVKSFTELCYKELFKRMKNGGIDDVSKVLGISGYSVSIEAIHIAFNVLSRLEIRPVSNHVFFNPEGNLEVIDIQHQNELEDLLDKGYQLRNRSRLSACTPQDPSIIWRWFEEASN